MDLFTTRLGPLSGGSDDPSVVYAGVYGSWDSDGVASSSAASYDGD